MESPVETIKIEVEIDAKDQLDISDGTATEVGLHPQLAVLEVIVYPTSAQPRRTTAWPRQEPWRYFRMEIPLTIFVKNSLRVMPASLTEFSTREDAFAPFLYLI